MQYRVAIIGSGFRSEIFIKLIKKLNEFLLLTGVLCRSVEKKTTLENKYSINVFLSKKELLASKPDFIINAVSKDNIYSETIYFLNKKIPVLQETGGNFTKIQLEHLASRVLLGQKLLIAEQYHLYPLVQAMKKIIDLNLLGEIQYVKCGYSHDYHSFNIIKYLLNEKYPQYISADKHNFMITKTDSREGLCFSGELISTTVTNFILDFGNKVGYHCFDSTSYRSTILMRHIEVVGTRGSINDEHLKYLDSANETIDTNLKTTNEGIFLGETLLSYNPLLSQLDLEEATLRTLLLDMIELIKGHDFQERTINHLNDAYLAFLAEKLTHQTKKKITKYFGN
ncbi:MAG: hypothetical protein LBV55_01195 [Acholeplasmatales bacterium]|jgi:predicted dehydrogenase|nr:hypothetical protein [Acholeplasmatales bacterium]